MILNCGEAISLNNKLNKTKQRFPDNVAIINNY